MEKQEKWLGFKFFSESKPKDIYIYLYGFSSFLGISATNIRSIYQRHTPVLAMITS